MFERLDDADLLDAMAAASRSESTAIAQRLSAVGELDARRARGLAASIFWRTDPFEEVAAEISAAQNISRSRASAQIYHARALRNRLPSVAAVFASGAIDYRMITTIIARTENVDDAAIPRLDEALARHAPKWARLSLPKLRDRIDLWVAKLDPAGRAGAARHQRQPLRRDRTNQPRNGVNLGEHSRHRRRRTGQAARRAGHDRVRLGSPHEGAASGRRVRDAGPARESAAVPVRSSRLPRRAAARCRGSGIHVLAEQATLDGKSSQPGYLPGFGILPAESVRGLSESAKCKPLRPPKGEPEAGYRPSVSLAEFVRLRDLTCRFPGCDAPAEVCDIDHTVPFPWGRTHPSNAKLYCRRHHLLKTFYGGPGGWTDKQLPDGTVIFTAPTGHTYTSEAHGATLFPVLATPTGEPDISTPDAPTADRALMMPTRKQTREQERRNRIAAERRKRSAIIAEEERRHQARLAADQEPPPF